MVSVTITSGKLTLTSIFASLFSAVLIAALVCAIAGVGVFGAFYGNYVSCKMLRNDALAIVQENDLKMLRLGAPHETSHPRG